MTLSLDDVRNKRFRMARKGGYEVLEVDEFVDEVEESFAQLVEENASLKKQVDALRSGAQDGLAAPSATSDPRQEAAPAHDVRTDQSAQRDQAKQPGQAAQPVRPAQPAPRTPAPEVAPVVVTTSAEASTAVVRLVQLSTEQAEHLVREATAEAGSIREGADRDAQQVTEEARTRAERLESEARLNAERVQAEAQGRSKSLDQELSVRRTKLFGELDRQRETLTETVARLRDFEQRYRTSLDQHLRGQLTTLGRVGLEPEGGPERTPPAQPASAGDEGGPGRRRGSERPGVDADAPAQAPGASDTPRLDALLGDQR